LDPYVVGLAGQHTAWPQERRLICGRLNTLNAAVWFSRDGRIWRALALPGDQIKGAGRQGFTSAIVRDGKLLTTAFDIPPSGGGCYVLELDLPK
jgi:hypothetical protein